jgi:hypothetical protein
VFLTVGRQTAPNSLGGLSDVPREELEAIGCVFERFEVPFRLHQKVGRLTPSYLLQRTCEFGSFIVEAVEAVSLSNTRYFGVQLKKIERAGR